MAAGGAVWKRAFNAMITMKKIDVAKIKTARRGWQTVEPRSICLLKCGK